MKSAKARERKAKAPPEPVGPSPKRAEEDWAVLGIPSRYADEITTDRGYESSPYEERWPS